MATLDVLTLPEAKDALNVSQTKPINDEAITLWVTAISLRMDELCGPVVQRTISNEVHAGGECSILPLYRPVSSVTTIVEYSGTGSPQSLAAETFTTNSATVTANDYYLDPVTSRISRRSSGYAGTFAGTRVVLTYVAGRAATTAAVDKKFKVAAGAMLRRLWSRESGAWARGGNPLAGEQAGSIGFYKVIDPMVAEFLADELQQGPTVPIIA
jgi:hypothetical protein